MHHIIVVTSTSIPVLRPSNIIKVSNNEPQLHRLDINIEKPVRKFSFTFHRVWPINIGYVVNSIVQFRCELHSNLKKSLDISLPLKRLPFQIVIRPPELPAEGMKLYWLNLLGQKFLIYARSNCSLLVSWKVITQHELSSIFSLISSHLSFELIPLTFQLRIFQLLFIIHV